MRFLIPLSFALITGLLWNSPLAHGRDTNTFLNFLNGDNFGVFPVHTRSGHRYDDEYRLRSAEVTRQFRAGEISSKQHVAALIQINIELTRDFGNRNQHRFRYEAIDCEFPFNPGTILINLVLYNNGKNTTLAVGIGEVAEVEDNVIYRDYLATVLVPWVLKSCPATRIISVRNMIEGYYFGPDQPTSRSFRTGTPISIMDVMLKDDELIYKFRKNFLRP